MVTNGKQRQMKYLHIVSVFPVLTETFVLREARKMRQMGCEVVIGQLRRSRTRTSAPDFEDLRPCVVLTKLLSWETFAGLFFFSFRRPRQTWTYTKLVFGSFRDTGNLLKLVYILLASMGLAFRLRRSGVLHVRGHHLHSEAIAAMFIAGFLGLPYSFKCYTVKTYYPRSILAAAVQNAEFIIADTVQVRDFLDSMSADRQRVHIVRNAVTLSEFPMRTAEPTGDPPIILAVGRLDYKKGFHSLLSACAILRDHGVHFRCVIVGDGDERSNLLARRQTLKLEEQVEMVGSLGFSEVRQWYERATLMVVPSVVAPDGSTDGLPTVVIEAFARGVPVVGTSTAAIPEVIQNGANGFVVPAGSAEELARRMSELLANRDLRHNFAIKARRNAERDFDLDRNARILSALMFGHSGERARTSDEMVESPVALEQTAR